MALTAEPDSTAVTQGDEDMDQNRDPGRDSDEEGRGEEDDDASGQRHGAASQRPRYQPIYGEDVLPNGALPSGKGVYAQKLAQIQPQEHYDTAARLLAFLQEALEDEVSDINNSRFPTFCLVHVPGTSNVRGVLGIGVHLDDPLSAATSLDKKIVAIQGDIATAQEQPLPIVLPETALTITPRVKALPEARFREIIATKANLDKVTYAQPRATDDIDFVETSILCPFPAHLALDTLDTDISIAILWERIQLYKSEDDDSPESTILRYADAYLRSIAVKVADGAPSARLATQIRPPAAAKAFVTTRAQDIFSLPTSSSLPTTTTPAMGTGGTSALDRLLALVTAQQAQMQGLLAAATGGATPAPQLAATTTGTTTTRTNKFGLADSDLKRLLLLHGLSTGQEALLQPLYAKLAEPGLSEDGQNLLIREHFEPQLYEGHPIPLCVENMKIIRKKQFIGIVGSTATACGTGLTNYRMRRMTDLEIEEERLEHDALVAATSTTKADHLSKSGRKKAKSPTTFSEMMDNGRTFANYLHNGFGRQCPLLRCLQQQMITPLGRLSDTAKRTMDTATIACVAWAWHQQSRHFAKGLMVPTNSVNGVATEWETVPEWKAATNAIITGQQLNFIGLPPDLRPIPPTPALVVDTTKPAGTKRTDKPSPTALGERQDKRGRGDKFEPKKMIVHQLFRNTIKPLFDKNPDRSLNAMCKEVGITSKDIFPGTKVCARGALSGTCKSPICRRLHDSSVITDAMAAAAVKTFEPICK
jgi:hypothetical protein